MSQAETSTSEVAALPGQALADAFQAWLAEQAGADGIVLEGFAAAVAYSRPDGTGGLTVVTSYHDPAQVVRLLSLGGDLVSREG